MAITVSVLRCLWLLLGYFLPSVSITRLLAQKLRMRCSDFHVVPYAEIYFEFNFRIKNIFRNLLWLIYFVQLLMLLKVRIKSYDLTLFIFA